MKKKGILIAAVVCIVSVFAYAITVYMPKINAESDYIDKIVTMIKNKEYSNVINIPEAELSPERLAEKQSLIFYAQALNAKEKNNIADFQYYLHCIPESYKGKLSSEIKNSREEAQRLIKEEMEKVQREREEKVRQEKALANKQIVAEVERILNNIPSKTDDVEKITWYYPWGTNGHPARDAVYWYVGEKDGKFWLRAFLVHFDEGIEWVFWDKVIFSTSNANWTYNIRNCFAGQTGGGKDTKIVRGGKYERLDVNFSELEQGYRLLATGNNPIIRFQGEDRHHDYYLTSDDINLLNTGIYLNEQLKKLNYRISK